MLDLNFIRQNPELVKKNNQIRGCSIDVDEIIAIDKRRRAQIAELDELRMEMNKISKGGKPTAVQIFEMRQLRDRIKLEEKRIKEIEAELNEMLVQLPNITHESVPVGKDERDNVVYRKWSPMDPKEGIIVEPDFPVRPHFEIGQELDLIDEEKGAKVSGARFWYIKNELVYLEFALLHYALAFLKEEGFVPMIPPMLIRERALYGTGFFPADVSQVYKLENPEEDVGKVKGAEDKKKERPLYEIEFPLGRIPTWDETDQYLIGTAEVPLAAYHADNVVDLKKPLKYCGFSSCFRREAGTYGKDMKGILRGHQFEKIEMFIFCTAEDTWETHEYITALAEKFWQTLQIPYRVMLMCSGDIGLPNAKKYDIEAWFPGEGRYREVVSASNDTDFQARRLNIKYTNKDGKKQYAHTLNSTLLAIGRALIAIMENYQTREGSILIPEVLKPYMFGIEEIKRNGTP